MNSSTSPIFLGKPHSYGGLSHRPEDTRHGRASVCRQLGIAPHQLLIPNQVHGTRVVVWDLPEVLPDVTGTDGLIVTHPDGVIGVLTADCVPVVITSRDNTVAAVLHAGWRGVAGQILAEGVSQIERLGIATDTLTVTLGPAALGCCYEVETPVVKALQATLTDDVDLADWATPQPTLNKYKLDLHAVLRHQAAQLGMSTVKAEAVCTMCTAPGEWWSHRRGETGRNLSIATLAHPKAPD